MDFWNVSNDQTTEIWTKQLRSTEKRLKKKQLEKIRSTTLGSVKNRSFGIGPAQVGPSQSQPLKPRSLKPRSFKRPSIASQLTNPLSLRLSGKLIAVTLSMTFISFSLAQAPTQPLSSATQESTSQTESAKSIEPAMLNDIMQIRQQLGGGLQETFNDKAFQQIGLEAGAGFASALERVASADATQAPETTGRAIPDPSSFSKDVGNSILPPAGKVAFDWDSEPASPFLSAQPVTTRQDPIETAKSIAKAIPESTIYTEPEKKGIRSVARKLDALAADLEDLEQFDFADDLRDKATDLRDSARCPFVAEGPTQQTIMR